MILLLNIIALLIAIPMQMASYVQTLSHLSENRSPLSVEVQDHSEESPHHHHDDDEEEDNHTHHSDEHQHSEDEPVHSHAKELSDAFIQVGATSFSSSFSVAILSFPSLAFFSHAYPKGRSAFTVLLRPPIV